MTPKPHILVVDDNSDNLHLLSTMLRHLGYDAHPVPSGRLALQTVESDPPDLVLLDVHMPQMSGYEVCQRIKSNPATKDIPVIFISALTDTSDKLRAFESGGVDYVTKPFQVEEVAARVTVHLELRRAQRALAASYTQLKELEGLRDKLVHMVVHDMRSPLNVVLTYVDMLKRDLGETLSPQSREDFEEVAKAAKRVLGLANDVLDVSRLEEGRLPLERAPVDIATLVAGAVDDVRALAKGREIRSELQSCVVVCDGALIRRVVENLLSNAVKHTPSGGSIQVDAKLEDRFIVVSVQDQGSGVPPGAESTIFEKFGALHVRKNSGYHSAGLGLAFSKLAVEAHCGKIGLDNSPGQGARFWVSLPVSG